MINDNNIANIQPTINYDTTNLTNDGYELRFSFDSESPELQEVINRYKNNNWPFKIVDGPGRQKHIWIKH